MNPEKKTRELTRIRVRRFRAVHKVIDSRNETSQLLTVPSSNKANTRRITLRGGQDSEDSTDSNGQEHKDRYGGDCKRTKISNEENSERLESKDKGFIEEIIESNSLRNGQGRKGNGCDNGNVNERSDASNGPDSQEHEDIDGDDREVCRLINGPDCERSRASDGQASNRSKVIDGQDSEESQVSDGQDSKESQVSSGQDSEENRASDGKDSEENRVCNGKDSEENRVSNRKDSEQNRASDGKDSEENGVNDGQDSEENTVSNGQDGEESRVSDGHDIEENRVSDGQDCEEGGVSDGQDSERSRVSDGQDSKRSRVSDGQDSEEGRVSDGQDSERSRVSDSDDADIEFDEIAQLRKWAIESQIPHTNLDSLLKILKTRVLPQLPKSSKTFLKSYTAEYDIIKLKGTRGEAIGEFVYFGISHHLKKCVNINLHQESILFLVFNIDGLPLFKSSRQQFWPILCKIHFDPDIYKVFPVAVYAGTEKPHNVDEYLESFVDELNQLLHDGMEINERLFEVCIKSFVCDRPARSFIKCIKNHGGYYACERCTIRGERCENRTVYISTNCEERTDRAFRDRNQSEHHTGISPLIAIPQLDMVADFALDFMHLCCLGIMKKLLNDCWMDGTRAVKMSQNSKLRLSQILLNLQSQVPQDFQRTTRSLADLSKWKATEFRFFLLYSGPVVLKNILPEELYKHFLLFHAACRILSLDDLALKFHGQAKVYLTKFVSLSGRFYGTSSYVLNLHSLIHMADDVKNMECSISKVTAFPFENALGKIKKLLRSGNRPLSQLCRRLQEAFFVNEEVVTIPSAVTIMSKNSTKPAENTVIKKLRYKEIVLASKPPDNTVLVENGLIVQIDTLYIRPNETENDVQISGIVVKPEKAIFKYPCNSEQLKMWRVTKTRSRRTFALQKVASKMVSLEINDGLEDKKTYVMPLLH